MDPTIADNPLNDPFLRDVPEMAGYKVLDRRYVIYSTLGQGGMGVVYRAKHTELEIEVAIKCLDPSLARRDKDFVARFKKEARSAALIQHENVVRVVDVADASGLHYLVMEFVRGEDARKRVGRKGQLKIGEAAHIALGAARGLAAAHDAGLVHRDMKPDNVLIGVTGDVKVADLGLAKQSGAASGLTYSGATMGTPRYMPPEQFGDAKNVGFPADVYALGATLYFLLTGKDAVPGGSIAEVLDFVRTQPFPDPRDVRPDTPPLLAELIAACTQRDPSDRLQHAREVEHRLETAMEGMEAGLADPDAGTKQFQSMVSPPPAETLAKIRMTVTNSQPGMTSAASPGQPGQPGQPDAPPVSPSKPWWIGVAALVVFVPLLWWVATRPGSGGDKPDSDPSVSRDPGTNPVDPVDLVEPGSVELRFDDLEEGSAELAVRDRNFVLRGRSLGGRGPIYYDVNGVDVQVGLRQDGTFEIPLTLGAGERRELVLREEGLAQPVRLTLRQDSIGPRLTGQVPTADTGLMPNREANITLVFDEELSAFEVDGMKRSITGKRATANVMVPLGPGSWSLAWKASDLAGNQSTGSVLWPRLEVKLPQLRLDSPELDANGLATLAAERVTIAGRIVDGGERGLELTWNGSVKPVSLALDGSFSEERDLLLNSSNQGVLALGDSSINRSFTLVQDSLEPQIDWIDGPLDGQRLSVEAIDVSANLVEANPVSFTANGIAMDQRASEGWAARVPLAEGRVRVELVARDAAGREARLERRFTVDRSAPKLVDSGSAIKDGVLVTDEVKLSLRFDEPPTSALLDGDPMELDGSLASAVIRAPEKPGPQSLRLEVCDDLNNCMSSDLVLNVRAPSPLDRVSVWAEVLERNPNARVVRDRSALRSMTESGLPWRVRDRASGIVMLLVPPGTQMIGAGPRDKAAESDERPLHSVRFDQAFYLGQTEVTQAQWTAIMGTQPAQFQGDRLPQENITYGDVQAFLDKTGLRLPLECEWEYACRAGTMTPTYAALPKIAWINETAPGQTSPVGQKGANAWGFEDMLGNVWEFAGNPYDADFYQELVSQKGTLTPDSYRTAEGSQYVVRGGSWRYPASDARASARRAYRLRRKANDVGFRVARNP